MADAQYLEQQRAIVETQAEMDAVVAALRRVDVAELRRAILAETQFAARNKLRYGKVRVLCLEHKMRPLTHERHLCDSVRESVRNHVHDCVRDCVRGYVRDMLSCTPVIPGAVVGQRSANTLQAEQRVSRSASPSAPLIEETVHLTPSHINVYLTWPVALASVDEPACTVTDPASVLVRSSAVHSTSLPETFYAQGAIAPIGRGGGADPNSDELYSGLRCTRRS
jgi:hypothetical protein